MVSAKLSRVRVGGRRKLAIGLALAAPVAFSFACGKLVGVEDTVVATGGASQSGSGGANTGSGGAKAAGGTVSTSGGSVSAGGNSATGGTSSGMGGKAAQGGGATTGGSQGVPEGGDSSAGEAGMGPGGSGPTGGASSGGASGAAGKAGTGGASGGAGGKANTGGTSGGTAGKTGTGGTSGGTAGKAGTGGTTGGTSTGGANTGGVGGGGACSPACPLDKPACEAGQCVQRGPTMVKVSTFYVDSTEVTVAQYQAFLTAKGTNTSGQPAVCSWNTSYYDTSIPMNPDTYPMSNVDWCDANAFCSWAGKRLCGKIGGGAIAYADLFKANTHQWYLACGGPNNGVHPNNDPVCNSTSGALAAVGTYPGCMGYYPGLYDLEGNVAEWVDGCATNTGKTDLCYLMGGGIFDNTKSYCDEVYDDVERDDTAVSFGFRCCSG